MDQMSVENSNKKPEIPLNCMIDHVSFEKVDPKPAKGGIDGLSLFIVIALLLTIIFSFIYLFEMDDKKQLPVTTSRALKLIDLTNLPSPLTIHGEIDFWQETRENSLIEHGELKNTIVVIGAYTASSVDDIGEREHSLKKFEITHEALSSQWSDSGIYYCPDTIRFGLENGELTYMISGENKEKLLHRSDAELCLAYVLADVLSTYRSRHSAELVNISSWRN